MIFKKKAHLSEALGLNIMIMSMCPHFAIATSHISAEADDNYV